MYVLTLDPIESTQLAHWQKVFVTFLIYLLTTAVYIGSAIFTASIEDFMIKFNVSQVAATPGLTLFVGLVGE